MVAGWLVVVNVAPHTAFEIYGWWYSGAITVKLFKYDNMKMDQLIGLKVVCDVMKLCQVAKYKQNTDFQS